ncbi:MAG: GH25 family lysozyme [Bacteroidota bacterium]
MKKIVAHLLISSVLCLCINPQTGNSQNSSKTDNTTDHKMPAKAQTPESETLLKSKTNLQGIDISAYQPHVDWSKVKEDNISFVFIKATGGRTYVDPSFKQHWASAGKADMMKGAYHFYYTKDTPEAQADFFISTVKSGYTAQDLPPVLDIETDGVNTVITKEELQKDILTFLSLVEKAFSRKPIVYTSYAFAQEYLDDPKFSNYYLWIAEYDTNQPNVPDAWKSISWTFWQNSPSAVVTGVQGKVDHDFFKGSMDALKNL